MQILLVLDRTAEALAALEEAREMLPNNPTIAKWIERLKKKSDQCEEVKSASRERRVF